MSLNRIYFIGAIIIASLLRSLSSAWAQAAPAGQAQGPAQTFSFFLPLILVFAIFYFLIIRPQQKQAKQRQAMVAAAKKGDQVILMGGIHGRVTGVTDTVLTVEIADNCKVKVERASIQAVTPSKENGE